MDAAKLLCIFSALCCVLSEAGAKSGSQRSVVLRQPAGTATTGCYFIVLKDKTTEEEMEQALIAVSKLSEDSRIYSIIRRVSKVFTAKLSPYALELVRRMPVVDYIEEEGFAEGVQSDHPFTVGWHLDRLDQPNASLDRKYWPIGEGAGVDVYILDSGIDYDHEEFEYRAKYPGKDPTDDYNAEVGNDFEVQMGRDCNGHGTHVASLCGGKTYGAAKKVTLYSVRVLGCNNAGPWSGVLAGIDFVATMMERTNRPSLISMSLSGGFYRIVNDAVARVATSSGAQSIMAAGNGMRDACSRSPASSSVGITVGGTREGDGLYVIGPGTNFGRCIDIFAPGERVLGADWTCRNCTRYLSGTSMATPIVTGLAAIMLGREPLISPAKLKEKLIEQSIKEAVDYNGNARFQDTPNRLATVQGSCGERNSPFGHSQISSPGFPASYPPNLDCRWLVGGERGIRVKIQLSYLNLEPNHDRLELYDGCCKDRSTFIRHFTGDLQHLNYTFASTGNQVCLKLITDGTITAQGFNGSYTKTYAGTDLVVPNPEVAPPPPSLRSPEDTQVTLLMSPRQARNKIDTLMSSGYKLTWISSYRLGPAMTPYFDFVATNSSTVDTVSYIEIGYIELNRTIREMKEKGYDIRLLIDRKKGKNPPEPSYSVIFEPRDPIFESVVFLRDQFKVHESRVEEMLEAGYRLISHSSCAIRGDIETTSVYVRDRRIAFGIPTPPYPQQVVRHNMTFFQFTRTTLEMANSHHYPHSVEVYTLPNYPDSVFSVVYEERDVETEGNWFRWSLNTTAARSLIETETRVSWDVYITAGYTYLGNSQHFIEFKRKRN